MAVAMKQLIESVKASLVHCETYDERIQSANAE